MSQIAEVIEVEGAAAQPPVENNTVIEQPTPDNQAPVNDAPPPPPSVENDYSWLKAHNINSENDLKSLLEQQRLQSQRIQELENTPTVSPYKTEFAKVADELASKGVAPETIARFHGLKPAELDNRAAILTKLEIEFPNLTNDQRVAYYEETYGGVDDELLTEGEKAKRIIGLEKEGANAREFLNQYVYQALNPNQVSPEILAKEKSRAEFWKNEGFNKLNATNEIKLPAVVKLPNQKGAVEEKAHDFVYQVPQTEQQALLKEFGETVNNPLLADYFAADDQGVKNANETYEKMFWGKFGNGIAKSLMEHAAQREALIHEHYAKLMNNTDFKGLGTVVDGSKEVSADKGFATWFSKNK